MADYQALADGGWRRTADLSYFSASENDSLYAEYVAWLAAGNTPDPVDMAGLRAEVTGRINQQRDAILDGGFWAGGQKWDSDERARMNVSGFLVTVMSGLPAPDPIYWRNFDNVNVPLSFAEFQQMGRVLMFFLSAVYAASWVHKEAVAAESDPAAVLAYDFSTGWPDNNVDGSRPA